MTDVSNIIKKIYKEHTSDGFVGEIKNLDNGVVFSIADKVSSPANFYYIFYDKKSKAVSFYLTKQEIASEDIANGERSLTLMKSGVENSTELSVYSAYESLGLMEGMNTFAKKSVDSFLYKVKLETGSDMSELIDRDILQRHESERLVSTNKKQFLDLLPNDDEFTSFIKKHPDLTGSAVNYYLQEGERGRLRREMSTAYPFLAEEISRNPSFDAKYIQGKLSKELPLMQMFGISKSVLRHCSSLPLDTYGVDKRKILIALNEIPVDWIPKSDADWRSFCLLVKHFHQTLSPFLPVETHTPASILFAGAGGKWTDYHKSIVKNYIDSRPPEGLEDKVTEPLKNLIKSSSEGLPASDLKAKVLGILSNAPSRVNEEEIINWVSKSVNIDLSETQIKMASHDLLGTIQHIKRHVVVPSYYLSLKEHHYSISSISPEIQNMLDAASYQLMFAPTEKSGLNLPNMMSVVRRVENERTDWTNKIFERSEQQFDYIKNSLNELDFPGLTPPVVAPNGKTLVPLTLVSELKNEGDIMRNCVGSYVSQCLNLSSHIVSVRDGETITSTIEFTGVLNIENPYDLNVVQHRACRNEIPLEADLEACDWYIRSVKNQTIPLNIEAINYVKSKLLAEKRPIQDKIAGYVVNHDSVNAVMKVLGKYIHKSVVRDINNIHDLISSRYIDAISYNTTFDTKFTTGRKHYEESIKSIKVESGKIEDIKNGVVKKVSPDEDSYTEYHYANNVLHRKNAPALITYKNDEVVLEEYYKNGQLHNLNGPAVINYNADGSISEAKYFIDNVEYKRFSYNLEIKKRNAPKLEASPMRI